MKRRSLIILDFSLATIVAILGNIVASYLQEYLRLTGPVRFAFVAVLFDRTRDFTGREGVFAEIDRWLADPDGPRYFIITGEPGIGKSSITAYWE